MNECTNVNYPTPAPAEREGLATAEHYRQLGVTRIRRGVHLRTECHAWHVTSHRTNAKF